MEPVIAIVGRPNVGKSTLFNRIIGRRRALVQDRPGITRDRQYAEADWDSYRFRILDTGGMELFNADRIQKKMARQALIAVEEADLLLVLMDGKTGLTAMDREWIEEIRKINKPTLYVVNKIDNAQKEDLLADFYELGVLPIHAVSAETNRGIGDLLDAIKAELLKIKGDSWKPIEAPLPPEEDDEESEGADVRKPNPFFRIALIGRPNVGKSTLLNYLVGEERSIADETPGTTRDPVDSYYQYDGETFHLVDTAGIRKRGRISDSIEKFSVIKSLKSIERADLTLLLLDGVEGISEQDAHVAGEAFKRSKAMILLVNKWDATEKTPEEFQATIDRQLQFLSFCPVLFISAKTGKGLDRLMPTLLRVKEQYGKRVGTSELNRVFERIVDNHPLPVFGGKNIKIFYATQTGVNPPTFVVFSNFPDKIHFSYQRYLLNGIKEAFDFNEVPVRVLYRKKKS